MRSLAAILAASIVASGCASTSYKIPATELQRIAATPPQARGAHVRVVEELSDADVGPPQPVTSETQIVLFPQINVYDGDRRRGGGGFGGGTGGGGSINGGKPSGGGGGGGSMKLGGGDGKGEAIVVLVLAAVALFVVAGIEGSRFDGYAQLHPMHPVHLVMRDGGTTVMPLAWIDPQTAAAADHGIVRSTEGPWHPLERAPLDRAGFTYGMLAGVGTYKSADGSTAMGAATTIQFGYFPDQRFGIVGSIFFGWRDNALGATLFESRYTGELQAFPIAAGPLHFGLYGGGGAAYRWDDGFGNSGSGALLGGTMLQLDVNTRIALTARLGQTYAHDERMSDAMLGLSVY